jgi:hypothetical protein
MPLFLGIGGVAVVVIILIVVFASGGGSYSDPGDACIALFRALRDGDGDAIYDLMSRDSRKAFEAVAAAEGVSTRELCSQGFKELQLMGGAEWTKAINQVEVTDVKVNGSEAVVTVSAPGVEDGFVHFVWEDGGWKLTGG